MTDKKLLELAAKAAGITWIRDYKDGPMKVMMTFTREWNPLTDDGDALRLAVRLKLTISIRDDDVRVYECAENFRRKRREFNENDPYAATRRAIVRAAAEIGKTS
jgi:hypothetical protein